MKSPTPVPEEKVKFPTPPDPEKVKSQPAKSFESLGNTIAKAVTTKERKEKEEPLVSLSREDGADAPKDVVISPEVMRKFGLRYSTEDWPPRRREKE